MMAEVEDAYDGGWGAGLGITPEAVLQKGVARVAHVAGPNVTTPFALVCLGGAEVNCVYQIHV